MLRSTAARNVGFGCVLLLTTFLVALISLACVVEGVEVPMPVLRERHNNVHARSELVETRTAEQEGKGSTRFGASRTATLLLGGTTIVLLLGLALRSFLLRRSSRSVVLPPPPPGVVESVSLSDTHSFSKIPCASIHLLTGLGVEGDAHLGKLVQHRSRLATRGHEPNLRQVHLIHAELLDYVAQKNSTLAGITAGQMGENILTRGVALLDLPTGTKLYIGASVLLELTGLRNPCPQLDNFRLGLMGALREEDAEGQVVRRLAGVMAVIRQGGTVHQGDIIRVELPAARPHKPLEPV